MLSLSWSPSTTPRSYNSNDTACGCATVNLASRMEPGSVPGAVQVTRSVYEQLKDQFVFEPRGTIEVKGKGGVEAWLLRL